MRITLNLITGALVMLLSVPAPAVVSPSMNLVPFQLQENLNGLVASAIYVSGSINAVAANPGVPNSPPLFVVDVYEKTEFDFSRDPLSFADAAAGSVLGYAARAESNARASPGTLRAEATVTLARPDLLGTGSANGSARASVSFSDVIFVGENGLQNSADETVDLEVTLSISGSYVTSSLLVSSASMSSNVWLLPYQPFQPLSNNLVSNAQYHERSFSNSGGNDGTLFAGTFDDLQPGSAFWLHAELTVEAGASWATWPDNSLSADVRAAFGNSLHVFIDPGSTNPHATYTTASGLSYLTPAPVPLPATFWLSAPLLAVLLGRTRKAVA